MPDQRLFAFMSTLIELLPTIAWVGLALWLFWRRSGAARTKLTAIALAVVGVAVDALLLWLIERYTEWKDKRPS
jgi:hypothetical protein